MKEEDKVKREDPWTTMGEMERIEHLRAGKATPEQLLAGMAGESEAVRAECIEHFKVAAPQFITDPAFFVFISSLFTALSDVGIDLTDEGAFLKAIQSAAPDGDVATGLRELVDKLRPQHPVLDAMIKAVRKTRPTEGTGEEDTDSETLAQLLNKDQTQVSEALREAYVTLALNAIPNLGIDKSADWEMTMRAIQAARPAWFKDNKSPIEITRLLEQELEKRTKQKRTSKSALQPLAKEGFIRTPSDRIHKATIEAFMPGAMRKPDEIKTAIAKLDAGGQIDSRKFWAAYPIETKDKDLYGLVGFTNDPGELVWNLLQKNGALAVKAQYALWARAFVETGAAPNEYIKLSVTQFCDDLGFKKKKRAHTKENKLAATAVFELLTSMNVGVVFQLPNGTVHRIRGPIWQKGLVHETLEKDSTWDPTNLIYAPGLFFGDEKWRRYNHTVALIGEGLLKLGTDNKDRWAVMIGGYLALLARMNGYRQRAVRVRFLLEKTGLWEIDGKINPGRMRNKLVSALDRLKTVGVVRDWNITMPPEDIDPDDLDNPETLENLAEPTKWKQQWLNEYVVIDWPENLEQRESELKARKEKVIESRRGRKLKEAS
jgi:hypothetical protein